MVFGWFSDQFLDSSQLKIDLRPPWEHLQTIVDPPWEHLQTIVQTIVQFWLSVPVGFPDLRGKLVSGETKSGVHGCTWRETMVAETKRSFRFEKKVFHNLAFQRGLLLEIGAWTVDHSVARISAPM